MATGNTLNYIPPQDFVPGTTGAPAGNDVGSSLVQVGYSRGLSFPYGQTSAAYAVRRLPDTASVGTGLTFKLELSDDPSNPAPGLVTKFDVAIGIAGDGTGRLLDGSTLGTATAGTLTLDSTSGKAKELSLAVLAANVGSAAANKFVVIRVRRLGTDSADTASAAFGRVVLHGLSVLDT